MGDQKYRLEPYGQRQLGRVKDCSRCYRRLVAALLALVPFAAIVVDHAKVLTYPTPLATEALGPSGKLQSSETLLLCLIVTVHGACRPDLDMT